MLEEILRSLAFASLIAHFPQDDIKAEAFASAFMSLGVLLPPFPVAGATLEVIVVRFDVVS